MHHPSDLDALASAYARDGVPALEKAQGRRAPTPEWLDTLVEGCSRPEHAVCSSWLLRAYLQGDAELDAAQTARLLRQLDRVQDGDARLHLCQAAGDLVIPGRNAGQLARFLDLCAAAEAKFLRAWAMDAYHRLALQHPSHRLEAHRLLERGLSDPAASVRARARRIQAERN